MLNKDERGLALPLVLVVMLVLGLLGVALWHYSMVNTLHVALEEKRMRAYYVARTGAVVTAYWLRSNPNDANKLIPDFNSGLIPIMDEDDSGINWL